MTEQDAGGGAGGLERVPAMPKTYLWSAVFAMLICCPPTGIVAVIKAAGVESAYVSRDYARSQRLSEQAKLWLYITVIAGFAWWLIGIGYVLMFMTAESQPTQLFHG